MTTYTYDEKKNSGRIIDGVPLHDLSEEEVESLTPSQRAAVEVAPFFVKHKPQTAPATKASGKDKGE
jgi:hypothetical protein